MMEGSTKKLGDNMNGLKGWPFSPLDIGGQAPGPCPFLGGIVPFGEGEGAPPCPKPG